MIRLILLISFLATTATSLAARHQLRNNVPTQTTNEVVFVDLLTRTNMVRHHTINYETLGQNLAFRRGESIEFILHFGDLYNKTNDKVRLEFGFGANPQLADSTLNYIPLMGNQQQPSANNTLDNLNWSAQIIEIRGKQVRASLFIPTTVPIGLWHFKVSTKFAGSRTIRTYNTHQPMYILFNPWNPADEVHLGREDARQEYVLNDVGKIYIGSYSYPVGRKWTYGQFEAPVLPSVIHLLDRLKMDTADRADAVKVARAVSAIVNSHDEGGLLVGNWSGNYGDGLAPWSWTGSAGVFRRFVQQGFRSVKFGQCWVFGGVTTTSLRTLGIPARTISNFVSAHDTDSSLTVDKFYSTSGGEMSGVNGDSIWNFHVWSDAWMARRDLPAGFGGWQAIDATPQEQSRGKYQLGPASLEAIKQGKVTYAYDVGFVYSEVNADIVSWRQDGRSKFGWRRTTVQERHVGRKILTKTIGYLDERSRSGTNDAEDIVNQYKHTDGSVEARKAHAEAVQSAGLVPLFDGTRR